MITCVRLTRLALAACALFVVNSPVSALQVSRTPVPGVTLTQTITTDPSSPQILNVISVDMINPDLSVKAVLGRDDVCTSAPDKGREIVSSMVGRKEAVAGVNGDFFPFTGDPEGLCIVNGELVSEPFIGRVAMGITTDRKVVFDIPRLDAKVSLASGASRQIDGINRPRETNQVIVYTDTYGPSTLNKYKGVDVICTSTDLPVVLGKDIKLKVVEVRSEATDVPIPKGGVVISAGGPAAYFLKSNFKGEDEVTVRFDLKGDPAINWTRVDQAIAAGPWLVKDGAEFIDANAEGFAPAFSTTTHPRTALGVTADNRLLMVTVDGRQSISKGISLKDLSALMRRLGAVNAINLDGGGSTTMSFKGTVINSPCEGTERMVANALVVTAKAAKEEFPKIRITGIDGNTIVAGQGAKLSLSSGDDNKPLTDEQLAHVIWGVTGAIGFVNQGGYFIPMNFRKGSIKATYGSQTASLDIEVVSGEPAKIIANMKPDTANPLRYTISASLVDEYGNPVSGKELTLTTAGGRLDAAKCTTNAKGELSTGVVWNPDSLGRTVTLSYGEISAVLADVTFTPGSGAVPDTSSKIEAKLIPDAKDPLRAIVLATLVDASGKPIAGKELLLTATGGKLDMPKGLTNPKGEFRTTITWVPNSTTRNITVSTDALTVKLDCMEQSPSK